MSHHTFIPHTEKYDLEECLDHLFPPLELEKALWEMGYKGHGEYGQWS